MDGPKQAEKITNPLKIVASVVATAIPICFHSLTENQSRLTEQKALLMTIEQASNVEEIAAIVGASTVFNAMTSSPRVIGL